MPINFKEPITAAQKSFIDILFQDIGFYEQSKRRVWLTANFNRPINYTDELTKLEASSVIQWLKDIRGY